MSSNSLLRLATRKRPSTFFRTSYTARRAPALAGPPSLALVGCSGFSTSVVRAKDSDGHNSHEEESFEEFSARCEKAKLGPCCPCWPGAEGASGCRRGQLGFPLLVGQLLMCACWGAIGLRRSSMRCRMCSNCRYGPGPKLELFSTLPSLLLWGLDAAFARTDGLMRTCSGI